MQTPPRFLALLGLPLLIGSCVFGDAPTGVGGGPARLALAIQPALIPSPADGSALPINRIRTVVARQLDGTALREQRFDVSPTAASWSIDVDVPVSGESVDVVVFVYLMNVSEGGTEEVQFSGRTASLEVSSGARLNGVEVDLVRGPVANLSVTAVTITDYPDTLVAGASAPMSATAMTPEGSDALPEVFWTSLNTAVLTTADSVATGVSAGTAQVVASAGAFADTVSILVISGPAAVDSVRVSPDSADVQVGQTRTYTAALFDAGGSPLTGRPVAWTTTNTAVATVNPSTGVVTGVAVGTTAVRATSEGVFDQAVVRVTAAPVGGATIAWTRNGSGNWSDGTAWSLGRAPQPGDTVRLTQGGDYTVTLDTSPTIAKLVLNGATDVITLNVVDQTLSITGTSVGPELDMIGSRGELVIGSGEVIVADIALGGTIRVTGFAGVQTQLLLNDGLLRVESGELTIFHDVASQVLAEGDIQVDAGAELVVGDNVVVRYSGGTIAGDGFVTFQSGSELELYADLTLDGPDVALLGAAITGIEADRVTLGPLTFLEIDGTGGASTISANLVVQGGVTMWSGDAIVDSLYVEPDAFVYVDGSSATTTFSTGNVDNSGFIVLSGGEDARFGPGAAGRILNRAGGFIETLPGGVGILDGELINQGELLLGGTTELVREDPQGTPVTANHQNSANIDIMGGGDLTIWLGGSAPSFTNSGTITIADGTTLEVNNQAIPTGSIIATASAVFSGTGTVDLRSLATGVPVTGTNDGTIAPGQFGPGILTWLGSIPMGSTGRIELEIDGPVPGTDHDQLNVSADLLLNLFGPSAGTLAIDAPFITPTDGDRFAVLTYRSRVGNFTTVTLPTYPGFTFDTVWVATPSTTVADTLYIEARETSPPANLNRWVAAGSGDWNFAANWSRGVVPVPSDSVVINALGNYTVTLDRAAAVSSLTIGRSGSTPTLQLTGSGHALSVIGSFYSNGIIELRDNSTNGVAMVLDAQSGFVNDFDGIVAAMGSGDFPQIDGNLYNFGTIWTQSQALLIPALPGVVQQNFGLIEAAGGNILIQLTSDSYFLNYGRLLIPPTRVITIDGGTSESSGRIEGEGTLDVSSTAFTNDGEVNPGVLGTASTGVLTINGSYSWGSGGVLNVELNGAPGVHDQLFNNGGVALAGTLFATTGGFTPDIGDRYPVLTFGTPRVGDFDDVVLAPVSGVTLDTVWAVGTTFDTLYVVATAGGGAAIRGDWTFDEGAGQVALDFFGQGNHGQLGTSTSPDPSDPAWNSGLIGTALTFIGGQVVRVPDAPSLEPTTLTVEAFVRASSPGFNRYIVAKGGGPTSNENAAFGLYTGPFGGLSFYTTVNGTSTYYATDDAGASIWDATWHHVAGTFDGDEVRLFVDGVEVGTANAALLGYGTLQGDLSIGALNPNAFAGFIGNIDEVRVWGRALTQAEIAARAARGGIGMPLSAFIGPPGTDADAADAPGSAINLVGTAVDAGPTTLAAGAASPPTFDFNTFGGLDRTTGFERGDLLAIRADQKYDGSPLLVDLDNDGSFADEVPQQGFGPHSNRFITFDLAVIRSDAGLAANQAFTLTGFTGPASVAANMSLAVLMDGIPLVMHDVAGPATTSLPFSVPVTGSARYLSFVALEGDDLDPNFDHGGFVQVMLTP